MFALDLQTIMGQMPNVMQNVHKVDHLAEISQQSAAGLIHKQIEYETIDVPGLQLIDVLDMKIDTR